MKRLRDRWRDWRRGYTDRDMLAACNLLEHNWTPAMRRAAADNEGLRHLLEPPPQRGPSGYRLNNIPGIVEIGWTTQQRFIVPPPSDDAGIAARLAMEELIERNILEGLTGGNPTPGTDYVQYLDENNVIRTHPVGIPYIDPWSEGDRIRSIPGFDEIARRQIENDESKS